MIKLVGILILAVFYAVYIGKMLLQKKQGIKTNQMAKGKHKDKIFYIELMLKIATYSVVVVEIGSIFLVESYLPKGCLVAGSILGVLGDCIFAAAVVTMKDSWRAGLAQEDETKMIIDGIYRFSRNPAFLGFDLVYIGILLVFFNGILLAFSLFAMLMLHLQILQEESYLEQVFGQEYVQYKGKVCRYLGRRK